MGGFVSRPKPPPPPAPVYVAPTKPEISQATATDKSDIARGKGRSSMILTGPQGVGSADLKIRKKTLLG